MHWKGLYRIGDAPPSACAGTPVDAGGGSVKLAVVATSSLLAEGAFFHFFYFRHLTGCHGEPVLLGT